MRYHSHIWLIEISNKIIITCKSKKFYILQRRWNISNIHLFEIYTKRILFCFINYEYAIALHLSFPYVGKCIIYHRLITFIHKQYIWCTTLCYIYCSTHYKYFFFAVQVLVTKTKIHIRGNSLLRLKNIALFLYYIMHSIEGVIIKYFSII